MNSWHRVLLLGLGMYLLSCCQSETKTTMATTSAPLEIVELDAHTIPAEDLLLNEDVPRSSMFNIHTISYTLPEIEEVVVKNYTYAFHDGEPLTVDLYYPPDASEETQLPTVIFGLGYRKSSLALRNAHFYTSWGKLVAAAGMVGVVYDTEQPDEDLEILLRVLAEHAPQLGIDIHNVGFMSSSANTPTVMAYLMQEGRTGIRFAVNYYGLSITPDRKYAEPFAGNCAARGCLLDELMDVTYVDPFVPLLIVKAGKDDIPLLNDAMDHFVNFIRGEGGTVTTIEYTNGRHGFDTEQHTEESAAIIRQTLEFMLTNFGLVGN